MRAMCFFSCERGATSRGLISCTQTLNLERRSVFFGATLHRAGRLLHRRSVSSVSLAGQWSRAGRGSTVAGQWSGQWLLFAVRGSRVAVPSLGRHTIVARNVCYADVRVVWHVFHVASGIRTTTVSGPMSIGTDCRNRRKSCPYQLEDNAFRRSIACARARRFPCVRAMQFFRASEARPLACEA